MTGVHWRSQCRCEMDPCIVQSFRHMVKFEDGTGRWQCVDCGQRFTTWPADTEACPANPPS